MKKSRRSPEQIIEILRQVEAGKAAGKPVAQLCKEAVSSDGVVSS